MRDSFIFYRSFYEAINDLPDEEQLKVYKAICEMSFNFNEIELSGLSSTIFKLIKPQLEANNKKFINGCKGGAPKNNQNATKKQPKNNQKTTKIQPKNNQKTTKKQPNDNVNVNDNENVNDNGIYIVEQILDYLNLKTSKSFKSSTKKTKDLIRARLKEGFTIDDFKIVIDKKTYEWLNDPKMNCYLRPETLFSNKFESYLNQKTKTLTTKDVYKNKDWSGYFE